MLIIFFQLAISIVIGFLGLFVFSIGIWDLTKRDKDTDLSLLFTISFISIIVFGSLTMMKFKYANDLDSASLYKDGICSLIGTCLSASLLFTTAIIDYAPKAWYIDPIVSLIIGVSAIVYGFRVVIKMIADGVSPCATKISGFYTSHHPFLPCRCQSGQLVGGTQSQTANKQWKCPMWRKSKVGKTEKHKMNQLRTRNMK